MGRAPCCDENGLKKGPWTPEEDQKLIEYIQKHGHGSWRALPKNAGLQRCGKSCRLRWTNYLRPDIKRGKFSFEEEQTILQLHAILGNKWSAIAARLPGRTDNEIKNYWNTHLKKRLLQMGIDPVTHRPRTDLFAPHLSHYFSSLSHMSHWESTRLEAEARWLSNYLKLAAAYRVSESANVTAMDGFNFLRSGNAGGLKTDDPAAATAMINWGALPSQAQHSQSLEHHQILQAACGTNVAENCGLNSAIAPASSTANNILENIWSVGLSSCGYPSLLNQGAAAAAASDSCLTTTTEETHHHNLLSWAAAAYHHDDDDDDDRYEHNKPASVSLPALVSESSCSAAAAAAAFKDKNSRTHALEESCNHVPPAAVEQVLLLDVSENSKLVASKQNVAALAPAPSGMASCITTATVATTTPQLWSDVNADEEEGKDYWTNVLKLIDPDTLPAGIEHIIRP